MKHWMSMAVVAAAALAAGPSPATADPFAIDQVTTGSTRPRVIRAPDDAAFADLAPAPRAPGSLGGGFIEFLVTGQSRPAAASGYAPRPQWPARPARGSVLYAAPSGEPYVDPFLDPADGARAPTTPPRRRTAALPASGYEAPARAVPARYQRQVVPYEGTQKPGTIVVDTGRRYLYLVQADGQAIRYGIGVGREGFSWKGTQSVSMKREWPDWRPPVQMRKRRPDLPAHMAGGPQNPLGARALYLGNTLFRIHGTNEPHTIGHAVSSGCIRMLNEDVIDLYERVRVGARVVVS